MIKLNRIISVREQWLKLFNSVETIVCKLISSNSFKNKITNELIS